MIGTEWWIDNTEFPGLHVDQLARRGLPRKKGLAEPSVAGEVGPGLLCKALAEASARV